MTLKVRLYFSEKLASGIVSKLSENQSHYIKNVIRLNHGDKISLFNSNNGEWDATILGHTKNFTELRIEKQSRPSVNENNIWLAFSPIKKIPQDFMLQKITELGIKKFIPILCERTVVRDINVKRAKKIVIEASEQSNRISIPDILEIQSLDNFLKNFPKNGKLIFCDINSKSKDIKKDFVPSKYPICILVGPEGDFSEKERQSIVDQKKTIPLSLAKNILRAETAAIAATTIVSFQLNFK